MSVEIELYAIEEQFWTGGPEVYQRYVDEHCLVAFAEMAGVMTKNDITKSAEKDRWRDVTIEKKGIALLSDSAIVITYECNAERSDGRAYHAVVSSGYVNRTGDWKLAFHQQTEIPAPKKKAPRKPVVRKARSRKVAMRKQPELAL